MQEADLKAIQPKRFVPKTTDQEQLILSIRKKYKYGQKRISAHLLRHHGLKLSSTTVRADLA